MDGWVSFHRKIKEWEWYTDPNTFRLFFHLVLEANHAKGKWRGIEIDRGQHLTSTNKLSEALNLSPKQIRLALKKLENTGEMAIKTTNKYTLVTVANYDLYQDNDKQRANKQEHEGQSKDKQRATNNNDNNKKNVKEVVAYLNEVLNSNYRAATKKTADSIIARVNEGYGLEDFKTVIDKKYKEWVNTEQEKYLRPETLFGTKFEGYLNQRVKETQSKPMNKVQPITRRDDY